MKIFKGIEMEFFDPIEEMPTNGEMVLVVLKPQDINGQRYHYGTSPYTVTNYIEHIPMRMRYCETIVYKTTDTKFKESTRHSPERYNISEVECWGRLKNK